MTELSKPRQVAGYPYERINYAEDKATADALAASLPDGATVITDRDETAGGVQTRRVVTSGVLGAPVNELDAGQVKDAAQTTSDVTVTVGAGGDFATINEALEYLSKRKPLYESGGISAIISLLTGFEMAEQVIVTNGVDLSWIKITSVDAEVNLRRDALTQFTDTLDGFEGLEVWTAAFMAGNNSCLPRIGCVFSMDETGAADFRKGGIYITRGSKCIVEPSCGIWDTDGNGVMCVYSSTLVAPLSIWRRNGRDQASTSRQLSAIRGEWQSIVTAIQAGIYDSTGYGVLIIGGSVSSLRDATIQGCAIDGLLAGSVSLVHARGVNITNNLGKGIYASEGSQIRLIQSTITGNGGNGVDIDNNSRVNSATGTIISNNGGNGVRISSGGSFCIVTPTIQNNALNGINVSAGEAIISSGNISGNLTGDLAVLSADSTIRLTGTVTTTSGSTADNNVTDSNVAAFNTAASTGKGGIYGRGGASKNRGTATIAAANTSVTVTHGVAFTPLIQEVSVTPTNNLGVATKFWISGMTSTQFTINVDVAPGAGGATFGWNLERIIT